MLEPIFRNTQIQIHITDDCPSFSDQTLKVEINRVHSDTSTASNLLTVIFGSAQVQQHAANSTPVVQLVSIIHRSRTKNHPGHGVSTITRRLRAKDHTARHTVGTGQEFNHPVHAKDCSPQASDILVRSPTPVDQTSRIRRKNPFDTRTHERTNVGIPAAQRRAQFSHI